MSEITSAPELVFSIASESASHILSQFPPELKGFTPQVGIICGSGLGGLVETLHPSPQFTLSYTEIPNFPHSTAPGHAGNFVFGLLGEKRTPVVMMVGRVHFFEGHSIQQISFPIRVMKILGIKTVIVTNAAGGLNPEFNVGDIMILNDHINLPGLAGSHPLRGSNDDAFGPRFPALSDAYDLELRKLAHRAYAKLSLSPSRRLHEGVYAFVVGPSYETRAECRMLRLMGADTVGMSTVPEIIAARHCGIHVLAMSLVTNAAVLEPGPRGDSDLVQNVTGKDLAKILEKGKANHEEVMLSGKEAAKDMCALVRTIVDEIE